MLEIGPWLSCISHFNVSDWLRNDYFFGIEHGRWGQTERNTLAQSASPIIWIQKKRKFCSWSMKWNQKTTSTIFNCIDKMWNSFLFSINTFCFENRFEILPKYLRYVNLWEKVMNYIHQLYNSFSKITKFVTCCIFEIPKFAQNVVLKQHLVHGIYQTGFGTLSGWMISVPHHGFWNSLKLFL